MQLAWVLVHAVVIVALSPLAAVIAPYVQFLWWHQHLRTSDITIYRHAEEVSSSIGRVTPAVLQCMYFSFLWPSLCPSPSTPPLASPGAIEPSFLAPIGSSYALLQTSPYAPSRQSIEVICALNSTISEIDTKDSDLRDMGTQAQYTCRALRGLAKHTALGLSR